MRGVRGRRGGQAGAGRDSPTSGAPAQPRLAPHAVTWAAVSCRRVVRLLRREPISKAWVGGKRAPPAGVQRAHQRGHRSSLVWPLRAVPRHRRGTGPVAAAAGRRLPAVWRGSRGRPGCRGGHGLQPRRRPCIPAAAAAAAAAAGPWEPGRGPPRDRRPPGPASAGKHPPYVPFPCCPGQQQAAGGLQLLAPERRLLLLDCVGCAAPKPRRAGRAAVFC